MRTLIVKHMTEINEELKPFTGTDTIEQYLTHSKMQRNRAWGTDVEIFIAANLMNTDIYVYTKSGRRDWAQEGKTGKTRKKGLSVCTKLWRNTIIRKVNIPDACYQPLQCGHISVSTNAQVSQSALE